MDFAHHSSEYLSTLILLAIPFPADIQIASPKNVHASMYWEARAPDLQFLRAMDSVTNQPGSNMGFWGGYLPFVASRSLKNVEIAWDTHGLINQSVLTRVLAPELIVSMFDVLNWDVQMTPPKKEDSGFNLFRLNRVLNPDYPTWQFPREGWTLQEAAHIGQLLVVIFGSMSPVQVTVSIFMQALIKVCKIPGQAGVLGHMWNQYPRHFTYEWVKMIHGLMEVYRAQRSLLEFSTDFGNLHSVQWVDHGIQKAAFVGQTLDPMSDTVPLLDQLMVWHNSMLGVFNNKVATQDSSLVSVPPNEQFFAGGKSFIDLSRIRSDEDRGSRQSKKQRPEPQDKNFTVTVPMVKLEGDLRSDTPLSRLCRLINQQHITSPTLTIDGKQCQVCFKCMFPAPHNVCHVSTCEKKRAALAKKHQNGVYQGAKPLPLIHMDIGINPWKNKPEKFWDPIVKFIKELQPTFKPKQEFKELTPSEGR